MIGQLKDGDDVENRGERFKGAALDGARSMFEKSGKITQAIMIDLRERVVVYALPVYPYGDDRTNVVIERLKRRLATDRARGVSVISEAWSVEATEPGEVVGDLSRHPNRIEIVLVMIEHHDVAGGLPQRWWSKIDRSGGAPTLGEWNCEPNEDLGGRFVGLLPPPRAQA